MYRQNIPKYKLNILRRRYIAGTLRPCIAAHELKIGRSTVDKYRARYDRIKALYPDKIHVLNFYLPNPEKQHRQTPLYLQLLLMLPVLVAEQNVRLPKAMPVWRAYRTHCPQGYTYSPFKIIFRSWFSDNVSPLPTGLIPPLTNTEREILRGWLNSNDHRNWQLAVFLECAEQGDLQKTIAMKIKASRKTVSRWLRQYQSEGITGLVLTGRTQAPHISDRIANRKDNLTKLLHETPKLHGINRTSWSIQALVDTYSKVYQDTASYMQLSRALQALGFSYRKSRERLTSPDPDFRSKVQRIQDILAQLGPKEKFFSIDEFGPFSIRMKGGTTLRHKDDRPVEIPQEQKSKGFIICTAALELATNQVTHFYSWKKDTSEMIVLIKLLLVQYCDQERLYLSWDAASWHQSKSLQAFLDSINQPEYRILHASPEVQLAPLPSCTQFMNVIESVFAGLAKAVVHNSDYASMDECRAAIDLHFQQRNQHFFEHPQKAGKKIWGKEIVVPEFNELRHTLKRSAVRGAR